MTIEQAKLGTNLLSKIEYYDTVISRVANTTELGQLTMILCEVNRADYLDKFPVLRDEMLKSLNDERERAINELSKL